MGNCFDKFDDNPHYKYQPDNQNNDITNDDTSKSRPRSCSSTPGLVNRSEQINNSSNEMNGNLDNDCNSKLIRLVVNSNMEFDESRYLIAIFDYTARTSGELTIKKGDKLRLLECNDSEWWEMEHIDSGNHGYVPSIYVAGEFSYESQDWFFRNITRKDAERILLQPGNCRGCFLIRTSESTQGALCLSVLDEIATSKLLLCVNHYKIKRLTNSRAVYISARQIFPNLLQLISYYSSSTNRGLCCPLITPCPRYKPSTKDLAFITRDRWEIDRLSLQLAERLGAGQFGEVWRAIWNSSISVAVKTLKSSSSSNRQEFLKEARIMKTLNHPNLVRLLAVCSDEPIYIVTEYMTNGSLLNYLRSEIGQKSSMKQLLDFISQIANGMAYLEAHSYVHRDLAARNILVGEADVVKIADFGLARITDNQYYEASQGSRFPVKWTAPEAATLGKFSTKSDVWSFGVLIHEIVTLGQVPYPSMDNTEALDRIQEGYRMPKPPTCPQQVYEIELRCWDARADFRPTFANLRDEFDDLFVSAESGYRAAECISR